MFQEITVKIEPFIEEVKCIYQHPLHYTYILHKNDGFLHLYDQATMEIVGKTKVVVLDQMRMFAFTNDFNSFYGLRENRFLIFQLSSSQWLAHIPIQSSQQNKPYLEAYYLSYYPRKQILICVTKNNFFLVNPSGGAAYKVTPQIRYEQQIIFPQRVAQISGLIWIIGYKNKLYFLKFSQNFQSCQICDQISIGNITQLSAQHHPKKKFIYAINDLNEVYLIRVDLKKSKIKLCYKFQHKDYIPLYLTLLRLGVNTSTTDKLKNRLYISIYCRQKSQKVYQQGQMMIEQNIQLQSSNKKFTLFIIPTDMQQMTLDEVNQQNSNNFCLRTLEDSFYIKNMPEIKISPWINIFTQNCLLFLTSENQVCYINFTSIKQLNLKADQWICMGYKFEQLQQNQLYEQRENQFENSSQKDEIQLSKQFLDDWSESNLPKSILFNKAFNRLRSFDL